MRCERRCRECCAQPRAPAPMRLRGGGHRSAGGCGWAWTPPEALAGGGGAREPASQPTVDFMEGGGRKLTRVARCDESAVCSAGSSREPRDLRASQEIADGGGSRRLPRRRARLRARRRNRLARPWSLFEAAASGLRGQARGGEADRRPRPGPPRSIHLAQLAPSIAMRPGRRHKWHARCC
jgi:hypothetical protein